MVNRTSAIETAKAFIRECNKSGLNFYKVLLFGSAARDTMHEWSDIDILLVSDQFTDNVFENLKKYSKINIKYPSIETHPLPTEYFLRGDDFIDRIKKESIELAA
jgi:predicted nucleotidyltransferase